MPGRIPVPVPSVVDVTLRVDEGPRYLINRITFVGNTTTRDQVIRRELRVYEGGVFNSEALKMSLRRLNQLGYFKPIEDQKGIQVDKTPNEAGKVDLTLEARRAESQSAELRRGHVRSLRHIRQRLVCHDQFSRQGRNALAERGDRHAQQQLSGVAHRAVRVRPADLDGRKPVLAQDPVFPLFVGSGLQRSARGHDRSRWGSRCEASSTLRRLHLGDGRQRIERRLSTAAIAGGIQRRGRANVLIARDDHDRKRHHDLHAHHPITPTLNYIVEQGRHVESRVEPTVVFDTVDTPFMPRRGMRLTGGARLAGGMLGGTVNYLRPEVELIMYRPHTRRTAIGVRGQIGYLHPYAGTEALPQYLRYFLGGENQIRGFDLRTVGPINDRNQLIGGNKFVLFNAEYYLDIMAQVRALAFHDAGQAFDESSGSTSASCGRRAGVELRVVLPVVNMPMRLIYSWNLYRDPFQPARGFRFASARRSSQIMTKEIRMIRQVE